MEVLTVIGILAVLIGIAVLAFRYVGDRARLGSARVTMENLRTVQAEAEAAGLFRRQPMGQWEQPAAPAAAPVWRSAYSGAVLIREFDFWRSPRDGNGNELRTRSPGLVLEQAAATWRNAASIRNTAIALGMMQSVPAARSALAGLPDGVARIPEFYDPMLPFQAGALVLYPIDPAAGQVQVYEALVPSAGVPPTAGVDTANWRRSFAAVLDPWGNPILFVPAAGLEVGRPFVAGQVFSRGDRVFTVSGAARTYFLCQVESTRNPPPSADWVEVGPVRAPDGRGFWASAGPDGNFDTTQDNVYSFEE